MRNRKWIDLREGKSELIFTPFYEDETVATLEYEEDGGWCYSCIETKASMEYLGSDSIEEAKEDVERLLEEHYQDEVNYYQSLLDKFKEQ